LLYIDDDTTVFDNAAMLYDTAVYDNAAVFGYFLYVHLHI
jgi:hypothetical protein